MKQVQVLMSAYNSEKYIVPQIESILNQTYKNTKILVRDDGSSDNTINILAHYKQKGLLEYYGSKVNIGWRASFFDLIHNADKNSQYFAFADHDDYWMPNRIENAIGDMPYEDNAVPILHTCRFILVDESLEPIGRKIKTTKPTGLGNALIESPFPGCTLFFNNKMLLYMDMAIDIKDLAAHDMVMVLLAFMFGEIMYGNSIDVLYRQHSKNASGGLGKSFFTELKLRAEKLLSFARNDIHTRNAKAVYQIYHNIMNEESKKLFMDFINRNQSLSNRINITFNNNFCRRKFIHNIILKTIFLFGLKY